MRSSRSHLFCTAACSMALGLFTMPGFALGQSTAQAVEQPSYPQQQAAPSGGWRRVGDPPTAAEEAQAGAPNRDLGNGIHVYDPNPEGNQQRRPEAPPPPQLTIQPGSYITVRVNQEISSNKNHPGDTFTATLEQPLVAKGIVVASPGQTVSGRVTEAQKSGRIEGLARLGVQLTELTLVDGQQVPIQSQFIDQVGPGSKGRDAGTIAATTAAGAAIGAAAGWGTGAAAGWGTGAAIGAGVGAAASTIGVLITRGHPSVIGPEEVLTFRLTQPVTIMTTSAPEAFQHIDPSEYGYYSQASQEQTTRYQQAANPPAPYYGYGYGVPYYDPYAFGYGFGYPAYGWGYPYWGTGIGLGFYYSPGFYGRRWYGGGGGWRGHESHWSGGHGGGFNGGGGHRGGHR